MNTRIPAGSIPEVLARMKALHVEAMALKYPVSERNFWAPIEPEFAFNADAHKEADMLMLDAFAIIGLSEIVEARAVVEKSFDGFWYG